MEQDIPLHDLTRHGTEKDNKMKFDQSLRYNTVPEWVSFYLDYSTLKRLIYSLEKLSVNRMQDTDNNERTALIQGAPTSDFDPAATFRRRLDLELHKVDSFYSQTEERLFASIDKLVDDVETYEADVDAHEAMLENPQSDTDLEANVHTPIDTSSRRGTSAPTARSKQDEDNNSSDSEEEAPRPTFPGRSFSNRQTSFSSARRVSTPNVETPRAQSPERLYRHSRIHSIDDSELSGLGAHDTASFNKRRSHSVSTIQRRRDSMSNLLPETQNPFENTLTALRLRTTNLYVSLSELRSFLQLNRTGFSKALKKFDKTLNTSLRDQYLSEVIPKTYIFGPGTEAHLASRIDEVVNVYASITTQGDAANAVEQLQAYLRESVVFDRNTVWRDQMELSRMAHTAPPVKNVVLQGQGETDEKAQYVKVFGCNIPSNILTSDAMKIIIISIIFFGILSFPILESEPQNRCLAVVITASLLWAFEAMPLFVTSLLVPFLVICLRIPCSPDGEPMTAPQASTYIFSCMWSPVIQLLLGGFTLASALSKYNIAKMLATKILANAGTNPKFVLLTLMFVATFLSMWISNVAAPVLCYSIAQSVLRTLPNGDPFGKAIVLGIALASNVGGMASPIASPQNVIALENMDPPPTWIQWFAVSIPVSILSVLAIWVLLILTFKPSKNVRVIAPVRVLNDKFGPAQWFISTVTVITIFLWCISHQLEPYIGDMGVLALIPIVVFFGSKLLSSEDFNNFLWTIIALAMGGTALGKAVSSSGLLATVAHGIEEHVIHGMGVFGVMVVFGFLILILATFVSHTVAALIILPLIKSIGERMEDPHPRLLVMGAAFLCSAAMGLPTSGFPNVTAICMQDEFGRPYLTVGNFISRGVPSSILAYGLIVTLGYIILRGMGF